MQTHPCSQNVTVYSKGRYGVRSLRNPGAYASPACEATIGGPRDPRCPLFRTHSLQNLGKLVLQGLCVRYAKGLGGTK